MKKKKAFTFLLLIFLAISSMMMIAAMKLFTSMTTNLASNNNEMKMARVQNAISAFFAKNNRLPCPADPTLTYTSANYGKESWDAGGHCNITIANFNGVSNVNTGFVNQTFGLHPDATLLPGLTNEDNRINFGMIPFKDMGLTEDEAHDAYSNKFTYITTRAYAGDRTRATSVIYKMFKGWTRVAMPARFYKHDTNPPSGTTQRCFSATVSATATTSQNDDDCMERMITNCRSASDATPLIITTLVGKGTYVSPTSGTTNGTLVRPDYIIATTCRWDVANYNHTEAAPSYISRENLAYALISHGKNGYGAWNKAGGLNQESTSLQEKQNTFKYYHDTYPSHNIKGTSAVGTTPSTSTEAITLISSSKRDDFDDEVIFQTIDDLLLESGRNANVFCHQSTTFIDVLPTDANHTTCMVWDMAMNTNNVTRYVRMDEAIVQNGSTICRGNDGNSMTLSCTVGGIWADPS